MPEQCGFSVERIRLRAQVQRQLRHHIPRNADHARIVHNKRIRSCSTKLFEQRRQSADVRIPRKGIAGNVDPLAARMGILAGSFEAFRRKVIRVIAEAHRFRANVDGVRAKAQRRLEPFHIACRGKQLRQALMCFSIHRVVFHESLYRSTLALCSSSVLA